VKVSELLELLRRADPETRLMFMPPGADEQDGQEVRDIFSSDVRWTHESGVDKGRQVHASAYDFSGIDRNASNQSKNPSRKEGCYIRALEQIALPLVTVRCSALDRRLEMIGGLHVHERLGHRHATHRCRIRPPTIRSVHTRA
jgi:hypothetical protein